ncbi:serine/threonine-protein kinase 36-like isoform X2 [Corythoichthys intestinalis]|uniref:serine/threonine-protein kinase 36-like isoform X2 n=1 Tax=Corythoichthys intestinalis TaxID=161448 RepID=UPI0025A525C1|nr:serine/threonine-protein kinase 36-like isoform X2 [Corythoichthys intestinalis]
MDSYHVLAQVGQGSFGRVHKGMKRFTGQVVALKFMPKMGRSSKELQSLKKEIDIMSNLQHPNIVKFLDSFETETEVVVVTEYAEGQLFQIIEADGSLPESRVCEIACQLVSALYYLHSRRILHRDMKPQNILFDKNGVVKLCDFGFARAMSISTMVVTSIKGTPLYMSPELVAEKPYDHTADLWALGCILYEIHTGLPPFCADSIFHLGQLIVKNPIVWPDNMSSTCTSFLKGLLIKDPQKRLSWPHLLHHPFVADGVQATLDPDMLALKLKQMAEKTSPDSGDNRIFRKIREQRSKTNTKNKGESDKGKKDWVRSERDCRVIPIIDTSRPFDFVSASSTSPPASLPPPNQPDRGLISQDYEREFLSVGVGSGLERSGSKSSTITESEEFWEKLAEETDPNRQNQGFSKSKDRTVISKLKSTILRFKQQLRDGVLTDTYHIGLTLKVLQNLLLTSDIATTNHIGSDLGLPCFLFDLVRNSVESARFIQLPWSLQTLGEMIAALLIYWEKNQDWLGEEKRPENLVEPFITILNQENLHALAPLAASVLSLFAKHKVAVNVDVALLSSLLKQQVSALNQLQLPLPSGWGLCDGLLSLLLHTLSEHGGGFSCLDPRTFYYLWKRTGTSLAWTTPDMEFCSTNGLYFLMSATLLFFCNDPYSYVTLFCESKSTFVYTLGWVLSPECLPLFVKGNPVKLEDLTHESFIQLSCQFLCLPFALDLTAYNSSRILQLYDSCGVVQGLLQVIQTLPLSLVELPLSLLRRLLLCDRQRSLSRLSKDANGFFSQSGQRIPSRTASSLLNDFLKRNDLGDSAVELLSLLYLLTCFYPNSSYLELHLDSSVLHQALAHSYDPIKAATCKVLGNLFPFKSPTLPNINPDIFKSMIDLLKDSNVYVRQAACLSVGKWLGYIAGEAGFNVGRPNQSVGSATESLKVKDNDEHKGSEWETGITMGTVEMRRWLEDIRMTGATLAGLTSDPNAHTRLHACAALGNLLHAVGDIPELLEESVSRLLLRAACTDSHKAVREAAIATLSLYAQRDSMLQVLISLNVEKKLLHATQHSPSECDYLPLIRQIRQMREL